VLSPPLVGVAVNVTGVAAQTGLAEATIETLTGRIGFTVMVTVFEVAGTTCSTGCIRSQDNSYLVVVDRGIGEAGTVGSCIYSIDLPLIRRR
jgi:hypothetical protein